MGEQMCWSDECMYTKLLVNGFTMYFEPWDTMIQTHIYTHRKSDDKHQNHAPAMFMILKCQAKNRTCVA